MGSALAICTEPNLVDDGDRFGQLVLRVDDAPIVDTRVANVTGFKAGDELVISTLKRSAGLEILNGRFTGNFKSVFPQSYRFQAPLVSMMAKCIPRNLQEMDCIVQVAQDPALRTFDNAQSHVKDAVSAALYAGKFNEHMAKAMQGVGHPDNAIADHIPSVKVAAPLACEVVRTCAPDILPKGSHCVVSAYPHGEAHKFVFDGRTEDFQEVPQAFFHFVAFSSGGREMLCDLQGMEDESGDFLLVDPVLLRKEEPSATKLLSTVMATSATQVGKAGGMIDGPTDELFDHLHPRCGQCCQSFDPSRRGAKGKRGLCGVTCMH